MRRGVVLGEVTTTKSKKIRRVDLSPQMLAVLQREKEIRQLQAMNIGEEQSLWVFLSPGGLRWDESNLRQSFYRCLDKASIRQVWFHDLRHCAVTNIADAVVDTETIMKIVSHSSVEMFLRYRTIMAEKLDDAMTRLNTLITWRQNAAHQVPEIAAL